MKVKICILLYVILFCCFSLIARPLSIAGIAKIKASSELNPQVAAENINDGIMAVENKGCWMAKGKNAWDLKANEFMTNNPKKIVGLEGYGLKITDRVPNPADFVGEEHANQKAALEKAAFFNLRICELIACLLLMQAFFVPN